MRTVALCTNSLMVSSVGASLEGRADLRLVRIDPDLPDAAWQLQNLSPDVAILDLCTAQSERAISLLSRRHDILLIGVHPASDELLVLSGYAAEVVTPDDLVELIETAVPDAKRAAHESLAQTEPDREGP